MNNTNNLSRQAFNLLAELRSSAEGCFETDAEGREWHMVYLDNVDRGRATPHQFAGYLSALTDAGLYKSDHDDDFGCVRLS